MSAKEEPTEKPPIFSSWKTHYLVVILSHILVMVIFTLITITFS